MTSNYQGDPAAAQEPLQRIFQGHERVEELRKLLEINAELGTTGDLDEFFQKSVLRAAQFLNFERALIAVADNNHFTIRWIAENGVSKPVRLPLPDAIVTRILGSPEPTWADDITPLPDFNGDVIRKLQMKQFLAIPLIGSDQRHIGVLAVLDRCDHEPIEKEDIRRAKGLAAEIAVVMEGTHNLHVARQHRERAENLMSLALELNSSLRLPQFVRSFTQRAADMLGARAAVLALAQRSVLETVIVHDPDSVPDKALLRRLNTALTELSSRHTEAIARGTAEKMLGASIATALGWKTVSIARLRSGDGELIGVLCLVDIKDEITEADRNLLHALSAHASVALENARLFTRMDQANRHWVEIFDSITDFIVVHDESNRVLRVNRTLADFIGVRPSELIGVSMRAMVAMASDNSAQP